MTCRCNPLLMFILCLVNGLSYIISSRLIMEPYRIPCSLYSTSWIVRVSVACIYSSICVICLCPQLSQGCYSRAEKSRCAVYIYSWEVSFSASKPHVAGNRHRFYALIKAFVFLSIVLNIPTLLLWYVAHTHDVLSFITSSFFNVGLYHFRWGRLSVKIMPS